VGELGKNCGNRVLSRLNPRVDGVTEYRLAPAVVLRVAGAALVGVAVLVVLLSIVTGLAGWPFWPVALVALAGLGVIVGGVWWTTRRTYVVRLDALGYDVRLVRGAGAKRARWVDVAEVATAEVHRSPALVVSLRDGRTTTIPVALLAGDRDEFANRLRTLLQQARRA
jgi:hypothetical protein